MDCALEIPFYVLAGRLTRHSDLGCVRGLWGLGIVDTKTAENRCYSIGVTKVR